METNKVKLRDWARSIRKELDLKSISHKIIQEIKLNKIYREGKNVMSYLGNDIEVSLKDLFNDIDKNWFLPKVQGKNLLVIPFLPDKTQLEKNSFNILEPVLQSDNYYDQVDKKINLDLILVPGLCFDKSGNRLGFGKGFYDSFLKLNPKSIKIGLCPKDCLVEAIDIDEWDVKMDLVITG